MLARLFAVIRKDLKGYFDQPTGYILLVIFVALLSYSFFRSTILFEEASLRALFSVDFIVERPSLPWLLAIFAPAATMRLLAEEQRDGTLEILLTQPIHGWVVLLAKFLSGFVFVAITILATLGIPIALETAGELDWGAVLAQYVGSLFLAASFVSMGLFTSSLTRNQIVSFILGLFVIMLLMVVGLPAVASSLPARLTGLVEALSPITHFSSIARGVIDLRDVLYFIAVVSAFLSATYLMIRGRTLSHRSPQFRNLQLGVAGLIVLSLLVGWFGSSIGGRLDLTEDKVFTLSPGTTQILSGLDDILTVEVFQSKDPPVQVSLVSRDVNAFLSDFADISDGIVKVVPRFPDPNGDEEERDAARKAQLAGVPAVSFSFVGQTEFSTKIGYLGVSMTYADRRERIPIIRTIDGFEYRLASLVNKMIQDERQTVAFLAGHGEKSKDADLPSLAANLEQQYEVKEIAAKGDTPPDFGDVDVLIIAGPTEPVPDTTRDALRRYLDGGGKAMILVEPVLVSGLRATPNQNSFADFLARYGVVVEDDLVFDMRSNETLSFTVGLGNVRSPYPYWMHVPMVDPKVGGEVDLVLLPWASSLGFITGSPFETIPLLETTRFSAIDINYKVEPDVSPNARALRETTPGDTFPSLVGAAVTGRIDSTGGDGGEQDSFRLVVVADSEWLTDRIVSRNQNNLILGLNLIDWLAQEDTLASIRDKVVSTRELLFTSPTHRNIVQWANILGVPLALVMIGVALYVRRRGISLREYGQ